MNTTHTLDTEAVEVSSLRIYPGNPRRGNLDELAASLDAHGQYRPLVVQRSTRHVLAGNHTLAAAQRLGWDEIMVTFLDVDDEQARRIVLVDNRTSDLATQNDAELAQLLNSLTETDARLEGTGFSDDDLDALLVGLNPPEPGQGGDTEPGEVPAEPASKTGQVWVLGDHRLVVGDSTDPEVWHALTGGVKADLMVTDPPYGIAYVGKTEDALTIQNDAMGRHEMMNLWRDAFTLARTHMRPGAAYYISGPSGDMLLGLMQAVETAGLPLRHQIIWAKDSLVLGRSDYHYQHEPILYGWVEGTHFWRGGRRQTTLWQIARPKRSREHPTMKPVEIYERALSNSSVPGGVAIEPFAGSGTGFIAAENMGRCCYGIEVDPRYADVIINRWEKHTGKEAKLDD